MSAGKRSRPRRSGADSNAALPPTKKARTSSSSHVPSPGLSFLTDERQRNGTKLTAHITNGTKDSSRNQPDETKAVIAATGPTDDDVDMDEAAVSEAESVDDESSVVSESSDEEDLGEHESGAAGKALAERIEFPTNGVSNHHDHTVDDDEAQQPLVNGDHELKAGPSSKSKAVEEKDSTSVELVGPSFGDMLQHVHPQTIDVASAFVDQSAEAKALAKQDKARSLQAPSATSLGTVLTQALRTNDRDMLESCLQTKDQTSIRSTIQRLQSPLVATLLERLAERLHKRPGRAGPLMVWVQWSLVAHGGYLASQPRVISKLSSLRQVVRERANSLQPLMTLKGKLDMLSAQVELRRTMHAQRLARNTFDDEDVDVIYVEGEEDESSSGEADYVSDVEVEPQPRKRAGRKSRNKRGKAAGYTYDSDDDGDDNIIRMNGIEDGSIVGSEEEDEDALDRLGLVDDEADESSVDEDAPTSDEEEEEEGGDEGDRDSASGEEGLAAPKKSVSISRASMAKRR